MSIQAVTFDVGGTLIEPWPSVGHVYSQVAAEHGLAGLDPERLNRQFAAAWRMKANFDYSRKSWSEIVTRTIHGPTADGGEVSFFRALYDRFSGADVWRLYEDVMPCVDLLLSRGVRVAVISNWDERLRPLMGALRLSKYFEFLAISGEIGFQKPSPVIFEETLRKLGCPAESVLHVGDSEEADVNGARSAGLQAVWLSRRGVATDGAGMTSLREIEQWLS